MVAAQQARLLLLVQVVQELLEKVEDQQTFVLYRWTSPLVSLWLVVEVVDSIGFKGVLVAVLLVDREHYAVVHVTL